MVRRVIRPSAYGGVDITRKVPLRSTGCKRCFPSVATSRGFLKRINVSYGPPVDYAEFLAMPRTRETAAVVIDRAMAAIRVQHAELRRRSEVGNGALR